MSRSTWTSPPDDALPDGSDSGSELPQPVSAKAPKTQKPVVNVASEERVRPRRRENIRRVPSGRNIGKANLRYRPVALSNRGPLPDPFRDADHARPPRRPSDA